MKRSLAIFLILLVTFAAATAKPASKVIIYHPAARITTECIYFTQPVNTQQDGKQTIQKLQSGTELEFNCVLRQDNGNPTSWTWEYFDGRKWRTGRQTRTLPDKTGHYTVFADAFTLKKEVKDTLRIRFVASKQINGEVSSHSETTRTTQSNHSETTEKSDGEIRIMDGAWGETTLTAYRGIKARDTHKIGILGNSFTYYGRTWSMLSQIARSQGHRLQTRASLKGGQTFRQHLGLPLSQDVIREGGYDYVLLQDQSMQHAYYTSDTSKRAEIMSANKAMAAALRDASPHVRIVLERTWAYPVNDWMHYGSKQAMMDAIINGCNEIAAACGEEVSPICEAMGKAYDDGVQNLYVQDDKHNGQACSYLKACVNYLVLFGEPFDENVPDCELDPATAKQLRHIAESIVL